ncbi:MFS transporter [Fervidibacillus albus]|uniref:MFS transporter n=1 Tax=Fervidibacillus albus TaxID=2980026 RepID=A0A9E8LW04_9BACI|nr:MFS transporter [Fervidibacillus albus]WAA10121.1 MFS transporter [Fervidibacillus albus]
MHVFQNQNFILLLFGRIITNFGDSLYGVASMLLVYEMTKSTFFTGLATFSIALPTAFQVLFGPFVDRFNQRLILVLSEWIPAVLIFIIPTMYYFDLLNIWMLLLIMAVTSFIWTIVYPTQQAVIVKIVDRENITVANSIMNFTNQGLEFLFTGISGSLIIHFGLLNIFWVPVVGSIITGCLFWFIKGIESPTERTEDGEGKSHIFSNYKRDILQGLRFIKGSFIPKFLLASIVSNLALGAVYAVLPDFAMSQGDERFYSFYLGFMVLGMMIGTILAPVVEKLPLGKVVIVGFFFSAIMWAISSFATISFLSIISFGMAQISLGATNMIFLSTLQRLIPVEMIGRVFSAITSVVGIAHPFGALLGGFLGNYIESSIIYSMGIFAMLFVSIQWLIHPLLRKIPKPKEMNPYEYGLEIRSSVNL